MSVVGTFKTRARRPCSIARLANKPGCYPWQVRGADPQAELELFICDRSDPRRLSPDIPSCIITCLVYEGKLRRISRKHRSIRSAAARSTSVLRFQTQLEDCSRADLADISPDLVRLRPPQARLDRVPGLADIRRHGNDRSVGVAGQRRFHQLTMLARGVAMAAVGLAREVEIALVMGEQQVAYAQHPGAVAGL